MIPGLFVSGTGTGVGKTCVGRGLARALRRHAVAVAAIKPFETDVNPVARDALALARACDRPHLAVAAGLYRVPPPLAPYAATLEGHPPPPPLDTLARCIRGLGEGAFPIVEGAGGLLVPVSATTDVADLAAVLRFPLLLVSRDGLGVLSHTLTAFEAARARALPLCAIVLTSFGLRDTSAATNRRILQERVPGIPVLAFPEVPGIDALDGAAGDAALADAADAAGLTALVRSQLPASPAHASRRR
ncbi:MAG: dethiobiotin synthase [Myxococcales bacterium]|nr:dethiobiotin synthase [Myxococcales bacterium]